MFLFHFKVVGQTHMTSSFSSCEKLCSMVAVGAGDGSLCFGAFGPIGDCVD